LFCLCIISLSRTRRYSCMVLFHESFSIAIAAFEAARCKGYEKLFAYVRADNTAALATYLSQGFRIIGTAQRHAKINGRYVDEIMIERAL